MQIDAAEVEAWLTRRLSEVLDVPQDQITAAPAMDDLGLDSITRAGLIAEIKRTFKCAISVEDLLECASVRALAEHVAVYNKGGQ